MTSWSFQALYPASSASTAKTALITGQYGSYLTVVLLEKRDLRGLDVDQPLNLANSVSVE